MSTRVLKLIDFLSDYEAQRHPPVHDISDERLYRLDELQLPAVPGVALAPGAETWLSVDFVDLPSRPEPPEEVASAIAGPIRASAPPELLETDDGLSDSEAARAAEIRLMAEQWIVDVWQPWSFAYRLAQKAKALYHDLFEQKIRVDGDRDGVELVWGFGMLHWATEEGFQVHHPLLAIPVEISIDEGDQRLHVRPAGGLELQTRCVAGIALRDRQGINAAREALSAEPLDPWAEATQDLLRRLVRMLHDQGTLRGEGDHPVHSPVVDPNWVLYLRRRRLDYQEFLEELRQIYLGGVVAPPALAALVTEAPSTVFDVATSPPAWGDVPTRRLESPADAEPLLLPLPVNEEQIHILELAQRRPGVTVQGPPGTGKTHTIANLLSHYVAYGKRVLIVAEKEQALQRVTEKVPEQIRGLTVSVLGADDEGRRKLGVAITGIQHRVSVIDRSVTDAEITRLTKFLENLDHRIAEVNSQLLAARLREVRPLDGSWPAGHEPSPQVVAGWLAQHEADYGYIPDRLNITASCPVDPAELAELCRLIRSVGVDRAADAAFELPALERLPEAGKLARLLMEREQLAITLTKAEPEVHSWQMVDDTSPEHAAQVYEAIRAEVKLLREAQQGWLAAVASQLNDPLLRSEWEGFVREMLAEREQILTVRGSLSAHEITLPEPAPPELDQQLEEAFQALRGKGRLGLFQGALKRALDSCHIDGHPPRTAEDVQRCQSYLLVQRVRHTLGVRWANQLNLVGGPMPQTGQPEIDLRLPLEAIAGLLGCQQRWSALTNAFADMGIAAPASPSLSGAERLAEVCALLPHRAKERAVQAELAALLEYLQACMDGNDSSPLTAALADAVRAGMTERYEALRAQVAELAEIAPSALKLRQLRARLSRTAPLWTQEILADVSAAGDPAAMPQAWQWRQLETWLTEISAGSSPSELQAQLERLTEERRRCVADLVGHRAWRRLADNLGDRERRALNSYLAAVSRYGKTGGKFAARWIGEMRRALDEAKTAVPVWVMTTRRALTNFRPERNPPFDVLIVDEASQAGFESLPLLALARQTIIVGDDQQTSPENVGLDQGQAFDLLETHLSDIAGYRTLFDPNNSLYDMGKLQFPDSVMLVEHFRSLPDIIKFSSRLCYGDQIEPLRDQPPHPNWSSLGAVKVLDGYRTGTVNRPEAQAVVNLIAELVEDPQYAGMTFGVVTLLAGQQAREINTMLVDRLGVQTFLERRIKVGEPADFQGDEREVVMISTVVGTDPNRPEAKPRPLTGRGDKRRINVAASRAQQQMWVVYSIDPESLSGQDLRAELIRHCRDPRGFDEARDTAIAACESDFEEQVLTRILGRGYRRVSAQYEVGSAARNYRIDLVVSGPNSRLAVECDGERWHGPDRWHADRTRQQVLERAGWTFERIRGSEFYRDPDRALEPLWARLEALDIPTGDEWLSGDGARPSIREVYGVAPDIADGEEVGEDEGSVTTYEAPSVSPATISGDVVAVSASGASHAPMAESSAASLPAIVHPLHGERVSVSLLKPHIEWVPRAVEHPATARPFLVGGVLAEIVATEGPMYALRAYQLYVKASGGHKVGRDLRLRLDRALRLAMAERSVLRLRDSAVDQADATLYAPGSPPVVMRQLGPRQLTDVPRSEVQALITELGAADLDDETLTRTVLDAYGLIRLTERAREYVTECAAYRWVAES